MRCVASCSGPALFGFKFCNCFSIPAVVNVSDFKGGRWAFVWDVCRVFICENRLKLFKMLALSLLESTMLFSTTTDQNGEKLSEVSYVKKNLMKLLAYVFL